jgi:uncharacterized protein (DUF2384 family)
MSDIIVINANKKALLSQLLDELKYAFKDLTTEELVSIFLDASTESAKKVFQQKEASLQKAWQFSKNTYKRYKSEGIIESAANDAKRLNIFVQSLPVKARDVYYNFLKLSRDEQIEMAAVTILTVAIFFAASGGLDFEGGLPDADIAIAGIGHHRSIFSHSIIIGLGVEFTGRFSILVMEKVKNRLPVNHHQIWDIVYGFIDKNKELAIAAMWLGIGTHLLKDSGIFGGGVKPYADLPISMPMEAHNGLFAANGIASGIFSNM